MNKIILLIFICIFYLSCTNDRELNFDIKIERGNELILTRDMDNIYNEDYTSKKFFSLVEKMSARYLRRVS